MAPSTQGRGRSGPVTWSQYQTSIGDRSALFAAVVDRWAPEHALYAGSYVDLSPSTAIPSVTYVDLDRRAARYFADEGLVRADLAGRCRPGAGVHVSFLHGDYTDITLPPASFDLLISLYADRVLASCRQYLAPEGLLLANTSHGDASLAALDPQLELVAAVQHRDDRYRLVTDELHTFLVPRKPEAADPEKIRSSGRGIRYTRDAFAYVFRVRGPVGV